MRRERVNSGAWFIQAPESEIRFFSVLSFPHDLNKHLPGTGTVVMVYEADLLPRP